MNATRTHHRLLPGLFLMLLASLAAADTLRLDKARYSPGETIRVEFEAASYPDAWAGIVPSSVAHGQESVNDEHDLEYRYLSGATTGVLEFKAPAEAGHYDVRLNDSDSDGRETASVTFAVTRPNAADASLELDRQLFAPGAGLVVHYSAPAGLPDNAWVGVVPADVPHGDESVNDQHDIGYQYLNGATSGRLQFTAPATAGRWTVRMHDTDSDGRELTSVAFEVGGELDAAGMAEQLAATGKTPVYGIRFASGQASLTSAAGSALSEIAKLLRQSPELRVRIEGHTDNQGSASGNMALSERRAQSVLEHLIQVEGIATERLMAVGKGAEEPVSKNETAAGRAQNRRVELVKLDG